MHHLAEQSEEVAGACKLIRWNAHLFERCLILPALSLRFFHMASDTTLLNHVPVDKTSFSDLSEGIVQSASLLIVRVVRSHSNCVYSVHLKPPGSPEILVISDFVSRPCGDLECMCEGILAVVRRLWIWLSRQGLFE